MTKCINKINENVIQKVAGAIRQGEIVVFRTDTVYGMGANAFDEKACERVYEIKQRPKRKPLGVLITDLEMLEGMVEPTSLVERELMRKFWPGALTMKLRKKVGVLPEVISAGDEFVRVRLLESGSFAYDLIKAAGVPVVAPSANLSGSPTGVEMRQIRKELDGKVDYILDEGDVEDETTSTIVQVENEEVVIIREGRISREEIAKVAPLKK